MADSQVPQTNAFQHLLAMFMPQTVGQQGGASSLTGAQGATNGGSSKGGQSPVTGNAPSPAAVGTQQGSNPQQPQKPAYSGSLPGMPVMNPQAWTQQAAGNFMPSTTAMPSGGNKGGQSAGGAGSQTNAMSSILKMFGGG